MTRRKTQEEFVNDVHDKYGKGYTVTTEYQSLTKQVGFKHECGNEWDMQARTMYQSKNDVLCPKCHSKEKSKNKYYENFYKKYNKEEFEIIEGTYTFGKEDVEVLHKECGRVIEKQASNFLNVKNEVKNACTYCMEERLEEEQKQRIREMLSVHVNHEEYEIISGSKSKHKLRHKKCGKEFYKYYGRINNEENMIPCPECQRVEREKREEEKERIKRERELYWKQQRDLTGKKFGYLTALEDVGVHGNTDLRSWKCICDCGEITYVGSSMLRNGHTSSCGCMGRGIEYLGYKEERYPKMKKINIRIEKEDNIGAMGSRIYRREDLTGKRFGKLKVLHIDKHHKISSKTTWYCICDCGEYKIASHQTLKAKKTESCGCLRREDLTGQKFGKLTALKYDKELSEDRGYTYWECECECGTIKSIALNHLKSGGTSSCGCIGMSYGEELVKEVLDKHSINYEVEYWFEDLRDINPLRYDFAIFNDKRELLGLIEFDGRQHFEESDLFIDTLEEIQHRDNLKNEYCKKNNIPLTRIPYTQIAYVTEIVEKVLLKNGLI